MSTAAVATSSIYQEIQSFYQQRKSDLSQLSQALQSGDLNGAQTAYNALVALGQGGPFANGDPFRNSTREQDFTAIGQALQSGDLAGAQQAFAQLESTFRRQNNAGGNQAPANTPAQTAPSTVAPEIIINLGGTAGATSAASTTNPTGAALPAIVINAGGTNAPEQVTLDLNNTGNGEQLTVSASQGNQAPEQVTLNLNQASNEQIVLNLFNSVGATSTTSQSSGVNVVA